MPASLCDLSCMRTASNARRWLVPAFAPEMSRESPGSDPKETTVFPHLILSCIILGNHTLGRFSRRLLLNCSDISIREKQRADVIKLCRLSSTEEIHSRVLVDLFVPRCFGRTNSGEQVANRVDTLKSLSIRSRTSSTSRSMSVSGQEGSSSDGASSLSCSLHWFYSPRDERVVHEDHLIQRLKQLGDKPKPPDSFRQPTCFTEVIVQ